MGSAPGLRRPDGGRPAASSRTRGDQQRLWHDRGRARSCSRRIRPACRPRRSPSASSIRTSRCAWSTADDRDAAEGMLRDALPGADERVPQPAGGDARGA